MRRIDDLRSLLAYIQDKLDEDSARAATLEERLSKPPNPFDGLRDVIRNSVLDNLGAIRAHTAKWERWRDALGSVIAEAPIDPDKEA